MSTVSIRDELKTLLQSVEKRQKELENLSKALRVTVEAFDGLPTELAETLAIPVKLQAGKLLSSDADSNGSIKIPKRMTQYGKLVAYFIRKNNKPTSARELAEAIGAHKNAISVVLYRTHKNSFESKRDTESARGVLWSLRPEVYQKTLDDAFVRN